MLHVERRTVLATTIGGSTIRTRKPVRIVSSSFDDLSSNNGMPTSTQTDRANSGEVSENPRLHLDDRSTASFASLTRSSKWRLTPLL